MPHQTERPPEGTQQEHQMQRRRQPRWCWKPINSKSPTERSGTRERTEMVISNWDSRTVTDSTLSSAVSFLSIQWRCWYSANLPCKSRGECTGPKLCTHARRMPSPSLLHWLLSTAAAAQPPATQPQQKVSSTTNAMKPQGQVAGEEVKNRNSRRTSGTQTVQLMRSWTPKAWGQAFNSHQGIESHVYKRDIYVIYLVYLYFLKL